MSEQRLAVVTGAARGIGRAIVLELLKQGRIVAGLDINADQLGELQKVVRDAGFDVITKCVDITDTEQFASTLEQLAGEYNGISILVNNAGITRDNLILRMSDEDFDAVIKVNLRAAFVALLITRFGAFSPGGRVSLNPDITATAITPQTSISSPAGNPGSGSAPASSAVTTFRCLRAI